MLHRILPFVIAISCISVVQQTSAQDTEVIQGDWVGTLNLGGTSLRIVFHINTDEEGLLSATLDSPDQGATGIPTSMVQFTEGALTIEVASIGGAYSGELNKESITGTWKQGGGSLPLELERMTEPITYNRPQEPKKPYPYKEEVVRYTHEEGGFELEGTLTLPEGDGPFPAGVLISGSGPQDRDESLMGHKPFLVLADYLTRQGIAVLRYDDRGVGESGGDFGTSTTLDFATDVEAAVKYLDSRPDIDAGAIGLIGHSEGALIAPIVATNPENSIAYVVMLAGPGLQGKEVLLTQSAKILSMKGIGDEWIEQATQINSELYDTVLAHEGSNLEDTLRQKLAELRSEISEMEANMLGLNEEAEDRIINQLSSPWMQKFMEIDPASYLERMKTPVLSIIGEKDVQVLPEENNAAIKEALEKAGNEEATLNILPGLNHLFQQAETGLPEEYSKIEETFSEEAMEMIAAWIKERHP